MVAFQIYIRYPGEKKPQCRVINSTFSQFDSFQYFDMSKVIIPSKVIDYDTSE